MSYKIAYIDEVKDDRDMFSEEISKNEISVAPIDPIPDLDSMVDYLIAENFDAIVVDYTLYANRPDIKYSGVELINEFLKYRDDFPAFIMTNNRDVDNVDDKIRPSFIFQKKAIGGESAEIIRKLRKEVDYYRSESGRIEEEFDILVSKRNQGNGTLSDEDLQRLDDLDETIEKRINKERRFNKIIKDSDSLKKLNNILDSAEDLFKNLKGE